MPTTGEDAGGERRTKGAEEKTQGLGRDGEADWGRKTRAGIRGWRLGFPPRGKARAADVGARGAEERRCRVGGGATEKTAYSSLAASTATAAVLLLGLGEREDARQERRDARRLGFSNAVSDLYTKHAK